MTRLSFRFDSFSTSKIACVVVLASSIAAAIAGLAGYRAVEVFALLLSAIAGVVLFIDLRKGEKTATTDHATQLRVIGKIAVVCREISRGNFEARITHINETGSLADVQWAVNDMIDRCDAFVREATASMEAVCRNVYYRLILPGGLHGSLRVAADIINGSVRAQGQAVEKARREAAAEQARIVDSLAQGLRNLADGNLTFRLADFPEAYRQVRDDFNSAMARLQETLQVIAAATREVSNATAEISGSTTDLSQRTEQQAASQERTSASMEEIASTVKNTAEKAQQASRSGSSARQVADRGGEVIAKAVDAMARIEASSRNISDIIGVIDEIARQTNLLALNAAVEAARAGDAGRGFAVVASEVRNLAQRSSQAAKDIKDLITNSNNQVTGGVDLVNKAGNAFAEIVDSIKTMIDIISDIALASAEQSTGIDQVNKALAQMDEVTQQNSALVEENAATAKTLEQQAREMDERIAVFKLGTAAARNAPSERTGWRQQRPVVGAPARKPSASAA